MKSDGPRLLYGLKDKRVYVAGHRGMVGSALVRRLESEQCEVLTAPREEVDLRSQAATQAWISAHKPQAVFLAAATAGGILANSRSPADFLYDNIMIQANVMDASWRAGVEKLLFLGSSCAYPKFAPQPIRETTLLTGELEPTNEWYAIAKIAGIKLCQAYRRQHDADFISAMPTNLYGENDSFDLETSHVLPALIAKAHMAKLSGASHIDIWGTGTPKREFLHVDDCADALIHLMKHYSDALHINVGVGEEISIAELARMVCEVVGVDVELRLQSDKPDGVPRKRLDVSRLHALRWRHRIQLDEGIERAYEWFLTNEAQNLAATC